MRSRAMCLLLILLVGDPRRWPSEPAPPGFIHFMDPFPYNFDWGATSQEELTARNLQYIQELIEYEGPSSVAAIVIEATVGTNGVLRPPTVQAYPPPPPLLLCLL